MSASEITRWLLDPSTGQLAPEALLDSLAARLEASGLSLFRVSIWIPTKHPELWGNQLIWDRESGCRVLRRSHEVSTGTDYVGTPAERLHLSGATSLRCQLEGSGAVPFEMLRRMAEAGATDYLMISLEPGVGAPWIAFACADKGGFEDAQIELLTALGPLLSLHVRIVAAGFATQSLLEVYLGANASRRVLEGAFRRGTGTDIEAALWFCDMRGFTELSDRLPPREVVVILDAYFEHVAAAIEGQGGEILKFIGDAVLAVFPVEAEDPEEPCRRALAAAEDVLAAAPAWSVRAGAAPMALGIALHLGRVMYGNIGGRARLDFTAIGASVNEVCRVESLCKELGVPLLVTGEFARALRRDDLVSLGAHALKGVSEPREILTVRAARGLASG